MSDLEALIREVFAGKTQQVSLVRTRQGFQANAVRPGGQEHRICVEIKPEPVDALRFVLMRALDRDAEVNAATAVGDDLLGVAADDEDLIG